MTFDRGFHWTLPFGYGYGTVAVNRAGTVSLSGSLPDGTKLSSSARISKDGHWPLYASLYGGKGTFLGWLTFTNQGAIVGEVGWMSPGTGNKVFPDGFSGIAQVAGERYHVPDKANNAFGCPSCSVLFIATEGGLSREVRNEFTLVGREPFKILRTQDRLSLFFNPFTGYFMGSMLNPDTLKPIPFSGVVLQKEFRGRGYYLGETLSGHIRLYAY